MNLQIKKEGKSYSMTVVAGRP
jgi:hypothetical protein